MRPFLVFISSAYTAETREEKEKNVELVNQAMKELIKLGMVPLAPHKLTAFFDEDPSLAHISYDDWIENLCYPYLDRCDAALLLSNWKESKGANLEHTRMHRNGLPHTDSITELCLIRNYLAGGYYAKARECHAIQN